MKIAIAGLGLIGGSFFKVFSERGHKVSGFDIGDPVDVSGADVVIVALHPTTAVEWVEAHAGEFKEGAAVVDTCGVKGYVMDRIAPVATGAKWFFVGGHPMAGKEVAGFRNSDPGLFRNASMILVPGTGVPSQTMDILNNLFLEAGFKKIVIADAAEHDSKIAYTSQLCHIVSSAYLRDELALGYDGFSAGSFRDMIRVGAPDPALWSELFSENRQALVPVIDRFIARMSAMRDAIAADDTAAVAGQLAEGRKIKDKVNAGPVAVYSRPMRGTREWRKIENTRRKPENFIDEWTVPK
ncbi:MAG: prephenate dehydrogenase [Kiritimatiellae bacterium]|nr:prephenate dehydrogenase [Kiritimatiellia bacterium]